MRLIDADELLEHAYRDRLDSRELIADMINNAPTVKKEPCEDCLFKREWQKIGKLISVILEKRAEQEPIGHWIYRNDFPFRWECDKCGGLFKTDFNFCPNCGVRMESEG